jgi:hypothetical protein
MVDVESYAPVRYEIGIQRSGEQWQLLVLFLPSSLIMINAYLATRQQCLDVLNTLKF